jgi:predicted HAD superfamily Cof-like phosphohydrolase
VSHDVFKDQEMFMWACGQSVEEPNTEQFKMYARLIGEEVNEFWDAVDRKDDIEIFDALLDIIVVAIGAGISAGYPMQYGWDEVVLSNMRKIDPSTRKVARREDGKILKPDGWKPPNLLKVMERYASVKKAQKANS